jgi:hypothetical protein
MRVAISPLPHALSSIGHYFTDVVFVKYFVADLEQISTVQETTSTPRTTKEHLLLGLPTLPTYTPPNGTRVQTDSGHSKVRNTLHRVVTFHSFLFLSPPP